MANKPAAAATGTRSSFAATPRRGLVIRSAEGTRLKGLRSIPAARRDAAVDEFLNGAK
jgi:hypothetical protein